MNDNQPALSREKVDSILSLYSSGKLNEAIDLINSLNKEFPNVPLLFNILGACYKAQGHLNKAVTIFNRAISLKPDYAEVHNNLGLTFLELNELENAISSFKNATIHMPEFYGAHYNLAVAYKKLGQLENAINSYKKVITMKPDSAEAFNNLGTLLSDLGNFESAAKNYNKAIKINPNFAEAYNNLGNLFKNSNRINESVQSFQKAIDINPSFFEAFYNLGTAYIDIGQVEDSIKSFKTALTIKPDYVEAYNNLGTSYKKLGQYNAAIESYYRALEIKPDYSEAHNNLGLLLMNLGELNSASDHFEKALAINPNYSFANNNFGSLLTNLGKFSKSIKYYNKAISIDKNFFEAHNNLGNALKYLKRHDESLACYEKSYELNPSAEYALGSILHSKLHLVKWANIEIEIEELSNRIMAQKRAIVPFPLLALIDNPELHQKAAQIYANDKYPTNHDLPEISHNRLHKKIRIGYFSPDFRIHPVANLTAELYEIHDRTKFEVYAFSFGPDTQDEMNLRIKSGVDYFHDVRSMSHKEVALLARSFELDIAIDLGGFTQDTRTEIFAMRTAPIQVNYLGYSSTMGTEYMDYIIADQTLIPKEKQKFYSEKVAYLPDSFMVNDTKNTISKRVFTREEASLPSSGFVFSCFNHHYKITPSVFASWMKILSNVKGSVLWLSDGNKTGIANLKKEAKNYGIDSNRLIFAPRLDLREDHLNRIKLADLFLDTLPYNAHATTSDALQVGLPVITQIGESFASRVAASLISSVKLTELITTTKESYEELAITLATDPKKLKEIKDKLNKNLASSPLYNTPLYTKQLEAAYMKMYKNYQQGLKPENIYV